MASSHPSICLGAPLVALALALTPLATAGESDWQLRFGFVSSSPDASAAEVAATGESFQINTDVGLGVGASLEYRVSRRLGVDLGIFSVAPDIGTSITIGPYGTSLVEISAGVTMTPVTAGLNVHLIPEGPVDVYLGPLVGYVMYSDFTLEVGPGASETFSASNELAWGANLGADIRFGKSRWSANAALKYLDSTFEARPRSGETGSADFDSTSVSLGVGYRF
jgi:outer membrane protein W